MNYPGKDARAGYPSVGVDVGPPATGATTGRGGMGQSSGNPSLIDDAGNILLSSTTNALVANAALTAGGALTVSGLLTASAIANFAPTTITAAGSVLANAAALTAVVHHVNGADDTKGVILPATGSIAFVYSNHATAGLKVYPDSGGTINGGSANAAVVQEGNTCALYVKHAAQTWKGVVFTANT